MGLVRTDRSLLSHAHSTLLLTVQSECCCLIVAFFICGCVVALVLVRSHPAPGLTVVLLLLSFRVYANFLG